MSIRGRPKKHIEVKIPIERIPPIFDNEENQKEKEKGKGKDFYLRNESRDQQSSKDDENNENLCISNEKNKDDFFQF